MLNAEKYQRYMQYIQQSSSFIPLSPELTQQTHYDEYALLDLLNKQLNRPEKPEFSFEHSFKVVKNQENAPLIIFFQGFYFQHIENYYLQDPQLTNLNQLNQTALDFSFSSFIAQHPEYNYICVKDNFQAWYLLHFEYYLAYLMQLISALQPTKIITAGCSAGGYAAILFGHYLFADQTFAFSPQTKVFDKIHMGAYREALNERYQLARFELTDLALLQQKQQGFRNQLHLFLSSGNREDLVEFDRLDWQKYQEIGVTLYPGSAHDIFSTQDKQKLFNILKAML
ncbi:hypothetical protein NYR79_09365 [Actinobacillus equuli subsp. haemolyticus]|uniref:hypothetical protein n=1 Tax=Actinobacillus equuli TaxID=718 RepID=UPI002442DFE3|nr:hypothetical protein [Actinobacillus equuli]WGE71048.1 hypothetical protein NYR79_09365 [Actinobacillus equuli subsp. haemolyticus]